MNYNEGTMKRIDIKIDIIDYFKVVEEYEKSHKIDLMAVYEGPWTKMTELWEMNNADKIPTFPEGPEVPKS